MATLAERARRLQEAGVFLGGPPQMFDTAGRMQLVTLLTEGLFPDSAVLDVGCGCLRGGYWLIHFLDPGRYHGIEPNRAMLEAGVAELLEPGLADLKQPRFAHNADFDFSVFGERFDFVVARSVWTHASKRQIRTMLQGFTSNAKPGGTFLTSYVRASPLRRDDYRGDAWVGRSHESDTAGLVRHDFGWVRRECRERGLAVEEVRDRTLNFGGQTWIRIRAP